jgi:hypothetical protein
MNSQIDSGLSIAETKKSIAIKNQKAKTVFFNMEMLEKIGSGQYGDVYLIRSPNHGNSLYALKCVKIDLIK